MSVTLTLVTGSIGRVDRLARLLGSLQAQTTSDFRLVIIEQRDVAAVTALVDEHPLPHPTSVVTSPAGLSRARNAGLAAIGKQTGPATATDLVAFPDDDCWYPPGLVARVIETFERDPSLGIMCGRQIEGPATPPAVAAGPVDRDNVWRFAVSSAIFARRAVIDAAHGFDEQLGVGAGTRWLAGEETDTVLTAMGAGVLVRHDPGLEVHHLAPSATPGRLEPSLGLGYGRGMGAVLRRHGYPRTTALRQAARPFAGAPVALLKGDRPLAAFRLAVSRGRATGYFGTPLPGRPASRDHR